MEQPNVGKIIAIHRKSKGLTQQDLAALLGVTNKAVSKWETGKGLPDISILPELSAALGLSIDSLLAGEISAAPRERTGLPTRNICFEISSQINLPRLRHQCKVSYWALDRLPVTMLFLSVCVLIASICAIVVARMVLIRPDAFWGVLILGSIAVACCFIGPYWQARRRYQSYEREYGDSKKYTVSFFDTGFAIQNDNAQREYQYKEITAIAIAKETLVFRCRGTNVMITAGDMETDAFDNLPAFLKTRAPKAKLVQFRIARKLQLLGAMFAASIGLCLGVMQLGYLTVGRANRLEYIYDYMFFLANAAIIILLLSAGLFLWHRKRNIIILVSVAVILLCGNFLLTRLPQNTIQTTTISTSPSGIKLIIKIDTATNRANICRKSFLWYVMPKDTLPHSVSDGLVKTQWLEDDVCVVTYMSGYSKAPQVYVATYGDRSAHGMSYYSVATALATGRWKPSKSFEDWGFGSGHGSFSISTPERREVFTYDDIKQYGTLALVFYQEGKAQWVAALGSDCGVDGGILGEGGSMWLSPVGMEATVPIPFHNIKTAD